MTEKWTPILSMKKILELFARQKAIQFIDAGLRKGTMSLELFLKENLYEDPFSIVTLRL